MIDPRWSTNGQLDSSRVRPEDGETIRYPARACVAEKLASSLPLIRGEGTPFSDIDLVIVFPAITCAYRESFIFVVAQSEHAFFALAQDQGTTAPVVKRLEDKQMDPFFAAGDNDAP